MRFWASRASLPARSAVTSSPKLVTAVRDSIRPSIQHVTFRRMVLASKSKMVVRFTGRGLRPRHARWPIRTVGGCVSRFISVYALAFWADISSRSSMIAESNMARTLVCCSGFGVSVEPSSLARTSDWYWCSCQAFSLSRLEASCLT